MDVKNVVIVGLGGVGGRLAQPLCQYLAYAHSGARVLLLDGDTYEPKNAERQVFIRLGNKAEVTAAALKAELPQLEIEGKPRFLTEDNVFVFVAEGSVVFACVDNHASRKLLAEHCGTLKNVVLISGGNEFTDGNVQVYVRRDGVDITAPITYLHPEIAEPNDRNPAELSCEERAAVGTPQLIFANLKVATEMVNIFYAVTVGDLAYSELYFDIRTGAQRAVFRHKEMTT